MQPARSHSLTDLVAATGFDRRTIVYYIQSGLLPKVGRRGPHTRYPEECLTRLRFIKGVRELQAGGSLLTATLAEIGRALAARDADGIRDLLDRGLPVPEVTALFEAGWPAAAPPSSAAPDPGGGVRGPSGERRSYGLADAGIRRRPAAEVADARPAAPAAAVPEIAHEETQPRLPALRLPTGDAGPSPAAGPMAGGEPAPADGDLGELLRELEVRPTLNARRSPPGSPEQWTEIPITSRVYLSVRGLSEDDTPLAEAVARLLKRALRARTSSPAP